MSLTPVRCPYTRLCEPGWGVVSVRAEHAGQLAGRPQDFSTALSWTAPSNQLRSTDSASSSLILPPSITETWRRTSQTKKKK